MREVFLKCQFRPSSGLLFPLEAFVVFPQEKSLTCCEVVMENHGFLLTWQNGHIYLVTIFKGKNYEYET